MRNLFPYRPVLLALVAAMPAACAIPEPSPRPANPFVGAWTNPERTQIAFREDTVVMNPPNAPPTPMGAESCEGKFRFGYARKSREALLALTAGQPEVNNQLGRMLTQPEYPVAEMTCGDGDTTYVMLDERDVVAIYRDRGIAGLRTLSRQ